MHLCAIQQRELEKIGQPVFAIPPTLKLVEKYCQTSVAD